MSNAQRYCRSCYANHRHRLSRRRFFMVFLVRADLGGIEEMLRRASRISVEDRADGPKGFADFARAGAMVLSAQRNDDALAFHVEYRLVRSKSAGVACSKLYCGSGQGFRRRRRSRSSRADARGAARRKESKRVGGFSRSWRGSGEDRQEEIARAREIAGDRKARPNIDRRVSCAPSHATAHIPDRHRNWRSRCLFRSGEAGADRGHARFDARRRHCLRRPQSAFRLPTGKVIALRGLSKARSTSILVLPAHKCCLQLPIGSRNCGPLAAVLAAAAMQSVSAKRWWRRKCEREKHEERADSHCICRG